MKIPLLNITRAIGCLSSVADEGIRQLQKKKPRRGLFGRITKHPRPHHKAPEAASHPFMSVEYLALHAYQFGVGKSVLLTRKLQLMC